MGQPIFKRGGSPSRSGDGGTTSIGRGIEDDTEVQSFPFGWDLEAGSGTQTV